jgi:radical SAM superfamily enzyme YgiQ (UPF0313 family)
VKRIALVCMTPDPDTDELGPLLLPSYGIRRVEAAVRADTELAGAEIRLFDLRSLDRAACDVALAEFAPDLIGFSVYVWSAPTLIEVARAYKGRHPGATVVFGGPSARTSFFDLPPYRGSAAYLDAVVEGDGEEPFRAIARLASGDRAALAGVPGLALPDGAGWRRTPPPSKLDLAQVASPFQMGLMPRGTVAYLETYRGCPLSCRFCEWGVAKELRSVFPADYIAAELEAFRDVGSPAVFLLDAGLNLNGHAFRNLTAAHERVPILRDALFWAEVYPAAIKEPHLEFLADVGTSYLGVGLQSRDLEVLKAHDRPANGEKFESSILKLVEVAEVEVQIIFGLPSDTPDGFMRTLQYALSLPVDVRAYHCLVLPDALMTRSRPEWDVRFDPRSLAMVSNNTWSREELSAMRRRLSALVRGHGGTSGDFWWAFKRDDRARQAIA